MQQIQMQNAQKQHMQKEAQSNVIDFHSQLRKEKAMAGQKLVLKNVNHMNAFNLLQDLRHLIILDFRSED